VSNLVFFPVEVEAGIALPHFWSPPLPIVLWLLTLKAKKNLFTFKFNTKVSML